MRHLPEWEQPRARRMPRALPLLLALVLGASVSWVVRGGDDDAVLTVDAEPSPATTATPERHDPDARDDAEDDDGGPGLSGYRPRDPWRPLPHSPLIRRAHHSLTWTGEEVIIWGGSRSEPQLLSDLRTHLGTGAAFEPRSERWRRLGPAPIPPRDRHAAVWTGEEVVVWGGRAGGPGPKGGAYDPVERRWRVLAEGPLDDRATEPAAAWTGDAVLVWVHEDDALQAARYSPADDAWVEAPALPLGGALEARTVWTDEGLVSWVTGTSGLSALYRFDVDAWAWEALPSPPMMPRAEGLAAAGGTVVVWGHASGEAFGSMWAGAIDAASGEVRTLPAPPERLRAEPVTAWTHELLLLWDGRRGLQLDLAREHWTRLPEAPIAPRLEAEGTWTNRELVVWGGGSGQRHYADGARLRVSHLPPVRVGAGGHVTR